MRRAGEIPDQVRNQLLVDQRFQCAGRMSGPDSSKSPLGTNDGVGRNLKIPEVHWVQQRFTLKTTAPDSSRKKEAGASCAMAPPASSRISEGATTLLRCPGPI